MSWDDLTKKVEFLFLREIGVLDFEIESLISLELKKEKKKKESVQNIHKSLVMEISTSEKYKILRSTFAKC